MNGARTFSIGSLAEAAGVSRRTVRFYVQGELLEPPIGPGRGAHHTEAHASAHRSESRLLVVKATRWVEAALASLGLAAAFDRLSHELGLLV